MFFSAKDLPACTASVAPVPDLVPLVLIYYFIVWAELRSSQVTAIPMPAIKA